MKRSSWILASLAVSTLVAIAAFVWLPGRGLPRDLLTSVPQTAIGVLSVRVTRVLDSPAYDRLVVQRGEDRGIRRLQKLCGFHPLRGIDEALVFALPGAPDEKPRVALLARGSIPHTRLIQCVAKLGRTGMKGLVHEQIEGIDTLRSKNGSTRAAFIGTDGVMAGDAEGVRAAIETMRGKRPSLAQEGLLTELYRQHAASSDLTLVAQLAGHEALFGRALAALGLDPAQLSAAGVSTLAAETRLDAEQVHASAELYTRDAAHAEALVQTAESVRARILAFPALSLTGFGKPLRELQLRSSGPRVHVEASLPARTLGAALEFLPAMAALRRGLNASPAVPVGAADPPPDEDADADEDALAP